MPVDLPSILDGIGFLGTVAVIFWLVVTGRLVPRKTHQDALNALAKKDEHIAEQNVQLGLLAEVGRTVEQLARGLQREMREP